MKKHLKSSIIGVTLLEIMLVLAIAAMVIMLSVRYYQSAQMSSSANSVMATLQSITAAVDNLSAGTGSYASASTDAVKSMVGTNALNLPWGGSIGVAGSATSYTVTAPAMPPGVCQMIRLKLSINPRISSIAACGTGTTPAAFTYLYTAG